VAEQSGVPITASRNALSARIASLTAGVIAAIALLLAATVPATASANQVTAQASQSRQAKSGGQRQASKSRRSRQRRIAQRRRRARARARRASRSASISSNVVVSNPKAKALSSTEAGVLDAGFENGLLNWNTAGVGEATPTVVSDTVRSGSQAARFALTGDQDRSELILGGNGGGSTNGMIEFGEGDEYWYGFSFYIVSMVYGEPGAHNLIMQFKGDDDGSPNFGLQLWDYEGDDGEYADDPKGLWSHGPSMDGDRFLAPVAEQAWHDVAIHFKASRVGDGFYELYLDGQLIDARSGVSMIAPDAEFAYIKDGLYRNGGEIPGTSEIRIDAARLGHSAGDVAVG
jgi:Polysaccharide lyase